MGGTFVYDKDKKYAYCEIKKKIWLLWNLKKIKGTAARGEPFYQGDILCGEKCFVNYMINFKIIFSSIIITIIFFIMTKVWSPSGFARHGWAGFGQSEWSLRQGVLINNFGGAV